MTDLEKAVEYLKSKNIEAFEGAGILVIPASSPEEIISIVSTVKKHLNEIGYEKSWQVDPYYYEKRKTLTGEMYLGSQ